MTATSSPGRPVYHHMGEPASSDLIDFFEERNRLYKEIDKSTRRYKIEKKIRRVTALEYHPRSLLDRLEGLLYSLLSAAALVSILWALAGLADFSSPPTQPIGSTPPRDIRHFRRVHNVPGKQFSGAALQDPSRIQR